MIQSARDDIKIYGELQGKLFTAKDIELLRLLMELRPATANVEAVNKAVDLTADYLRGNGVGNVVVEDLGGRKILYASTTGSRSPALLLNVHLDVVPAVCEEDYILGIKDGFFIGRGTSDCLGHALLAIRFLIDSIGRYDVGVIFSTDEETGGKSTEFMVSRGYGASRMILVIDSAYKEICIAQKGIVVLKLSASGAGGHSAYPFGIVNPVDKLVRGYSKLLDYWENPEEESDYRNTMAACRLSAGDADNQIPGKAEITLNFRYTEQSDREKIIEKVREITGLDVRVAATCEPVEVDCASEEILLLREIMRRRLECSDVDFSRSCGATDARYFASCGVPLAMIGGDGCGMHSKDEKMRIDSLESELYDVLCEFAASIAVIPEK
jgi:acetylornithine deacetylase/succinyl-diaminopimelate desuccinylase-like protein